MTREIPLSKGLFALVDDNDYERISCHKWYASFDGKYYARRNETISKSKRIHIKMHREILGYFGELQIDHINGDTLDNRKSNLRICTPNKIQETKKQEKIILWGIRESVNLEGFLGRTFT